MALFTVTDRCTGCGLCAKVCPASLVRQSAQGERPSPWAGREAQCIRCGHCVAVCKAGALVHATPIGGFVSMNRSFFSTDSAGLPEKNTGGQEGATAPGNRSSGAVGDVWENRLFGQ